MQIPSQQDIENFLHGNDPEKYIVSLEFGYRTGKIYKIVRVATEISTAVGIGKPLDNGEISRDHELFNLSVHFFSLYLGLLAGWYTGYLNSLPEAEEGMRTLFNQAIEGIAK